MTTSIPTTVHGVDTERAPLDKHVEVSVVIGASCHLVHAWECQFDTCLGHLVQLMYKTHHAKVRGEVSVVARRVVVVDASQERGDGVDVRGFLNGLEECHAASPIVIVDTFLGLEAKVGEESMGEANDVLVTPNWEHDRVCGVKTWDSQFQNSPQKIVAISQFRADHIDEQVDFGV